MTDGTRERRHQDEHGVDWGWGERPKFSVFTSDSSKKVDRGTVRDVERVGINTPRSDFDSVLVIERYQGHPSHMVGSDRCQLVHQQLDVVTIQ